MRARRPGRTGSRSPDTQAGTPRRLGLHSYTYVLEAAAPPPGLASRSAGAISSSGSWKPAPWSLSAKGTSSSTAPTTECSPRRDAASRSRAGASPPSTWTESGAAHKTNPATEVLQTGRPRCSVARLPTAFASFSSATVFPAAFAAGPVFAASATLATAAGAMFPVATAGMFAGTDLDVRAEPREGL